MLSENFLVCINIRRSIRRMISLSSCLNSCGVDILYQLLSAAHIFVNNEAFNC